MSKVMILQWTFVSILLLSAMPVAVLAQPAEASRTKPAEMTTWAKGTVRDEAGKPVAGAQVYARATHYGGIRMYGITRKAVTDAEGRYSIEGEKNLSSFSASLVAHVVGRPPAFAWVQSEPNWGETAWGRGAIKLPNKDIDFAIPATGGMLEVLVTRGGKPVVGVEVALRLQGIDPFDSWGLEQQTEQQKALYATCRPVWRTGPGGVARFEALAPGCYSIVAAGGEHTALFFTDNLRWFPFGEEPVYGEARDISVRVGHTTTHRLAMFRHGCVTKFSILRDGKDWIAEERLLPQSKSPSGDSEYSPTWIGQEWTDTFRFETAGLKQVSFAKYTGSSRRNLPFDSADGVIAASPRLSNIQPVKLVAATNRGGGVLVRIEDAEGRPVAGLARFGNTNFQDVSQEGTLIRGFEPGTGNVEGRMSGTRRIFPSENKSVMPDDDSLVGRSEILPQRVTIENNEVREVTLRPEKVGYVKGRVRVPEGQKPSDYRPILGKAEYQNGAGIFYEGDTGNFLAGPFRAGTASLYMSSWATRIPLFKREVSVQTGQVTEIELEAPYPIAATLPLTRRFVNGSVFLSDAKTPAYLAWVARHASTDEHPWGVGTTDYLGNIWPHAVWAPYRENEVELPGTPRDPYVAAWLPGQSGVAIVPVPEKSVPDQAEQPVEITLPPAISLRGKVSVEGEGETVDNGTIRVRAQHEGLGKLDDLLSIETTAGADGAFELAGLTPGTYRVQAALDEIWLSASLTLTVGDEAALDPVALTIPAPGGPVLVRLLGTQSDDAPTKLFVARPAGPLTDRLWPKSFVPDGAGVVRIPALEAGRHTIRIAGKETVIDVPPLTMSGGQALDLMVDQSK